MLSYSCFIELISIQRSYSYDLLNHWNAVYIALSYNVDICYFCLLSNIFPSWANLLQSLTHLLRTCNEYKKWIHDIIFHTEYFLFLKIIRASKKHGWLWTFLDDINFLKKKLENVQILKLRYLDCIFFFTK